MAMGKLSSLGLGSSVLNYDVIDKLKKADEKALIGPTDRKLEQNVEKQKNLIEIKEKLSALYSNVKSLSDFSSYIARDVHVSGSAIEASAAPGVPTQDINVAIRSLAKNDINEVDTKYASKDAEFSKEDGVLEFFSNSKNYKVNIKAGMTLSDVAQAITDATNGSVLGIVMKTGGQNPYQLMINSKSSGEESRVYFGSILKSEKIPQAPIDIQGEQDFFVEIKDKNGLPQKVSINLKLGANSAAEQKPEAIRDALKKAFEDSPSLKELYDKGDINVGLSDEGKSVLINDRRGLPVIVGGTKAGTLGFYKNNLESKSDDMLEAKTAVKAGQILGSIKVGDTSLDLSTLTKEGNTSEDNAKAIAEALNKIDGVNAKEVDAKLALNSSKGTIKLSADGKENKEALEALGLKEGELADYSKIQKDIFRFKNIQTASDAEFTFNGAEIRRPTNQVNDIIGGLTITLNSVTPKDSPVTISVKNNTKGIIDGVKDFVKAYNELVPVLDASTRYDPETRKGGVFNTESTIREIRPNLNQAILHSVGVGIDVKSLVSYGITINDKSVMSLDESKLSSMVNSDPEAAKNLFYGKDGKDSFGKDKLTPGVFPQISKVLADLLDGGNAKLKIFEQNLEKEVKSLDKDKKQAMELLNSRYDTMASRFAAYDEQISKANNSFSSVQMLIDQAANAKKK
ncbi:flagellar filament capping protein FliD [Helicobacter sp. 11S02629-2]|uniref:flagellar filament capping protein FliD n=1 Tax=Helicobacter sp. 11S02629-2 TaxID=1476195 RepID=UPI000BA58904|nr:flagellar filament capping protein FliD [Helicobacter sp. 11S02629-2]PAF43656.1 flagellar capping protein [Helicobacter sp. 11S02629-2]